MSEFRQNLVSGDWIIVAPERAKRPHDFLPKSRRRQVGPKSKCPFEDLKKTGNWPPILSYPNEKNWKAVIIPNKYPAITHFHQVCPSPQEEGPYKRMQSVGHHDLVVTRDHRKNLSQVSAKDGLKIFELIQKRCKMFVTDECMTYVSIFYNYGPSAGASISHPHYQILALPIVPPHVKRSLEGSESYYKAHRSCVHCDSIKYERKVGTRVIAEDKYAIVVSPYASQHPFEVRVYPKPHESRFETTPAPILKSVASLLGQALRKIAKHLNDPDLNFFIHTSPLKYKSYNHYHWHIEIMPKITVPAGFEISTGVEINVIDPAQAAKILRGEFNPK